jgi:hypothetical protein
LVIILPKEVADATPLQGVRKLKKNTAVDRPSSGRSLFHSRSRKNINMLIQITIVFSTAIRQPAERIDAGRDQPIQDWNDLSPHSVP